MSKLGTFVQGGPNFVHRSSFSLVRFFSTSDGFCQIVDDYGIGREYVSTGMANTEES